MRRLMGVFANLRPVLTYPLIESSPLKNHVP